MRTRVWKGKILQKNVCMCTLYRCCLSLVCTLYFVHTLVHGQNNGEDPPSKRKVKTNNGEEMAKPVVAPTYREGPTHTRHTFGRVPYVHRAWTGICVRMDGGVPAAFSDSELHPIYCSLALPLSVDQSN